MRSFSRTSATGLPRAASRHEPGTVSPAALRIAQEADATMSPDSWEADYSPPDLLAAAPAASPVLSAAQVAPTA
ncbi:hypothetical protein [Hymenobacter psoromatis]|uniref:hypothetical protein n=1 Tax=Hymenobacter psoromatis TaxID=1484116 RepID=UPI001CBC1A59|nr:hypothetical protein [Hymenobacter psoromatis]